MKLSTTVSPILLLPAFVPLYNNALAGEVHQTEKPNVLIIMADQWRGSALGFLKVEPVKTPNLDKLAGESVVFSNAVSNYPVSSPARAMFMTGLYPTKTGVRTNCTSSSEPYGCELAADKNCWSDVLRNQNYELGYIGKWHLDSPHRPYIPTNNNLGKIAWNEWTPPERRHGFSYWLAYGTYDYHLRPMYWSTKAPRDSFKFVDQWGPEYEADNAINYLENKDGQYRKSGHPFALMVSMNPPHTGYELVPDKYKAIYRDADVEKLCCAPDVPLKGTKYGDYYRNNIRNYYACISGVDDQIGRIIHSLQSLGLDKNTIVVFLSDHGNCIGRHNEISKNVFFEESMKIPLIIRYPAKLKPQVSTIPISIPDVTASLLEWTTNQSENRKEMDGISCCRYLETGRGQIPTGQLYFKMGYRPLQSDPKLIDSEENQDDEYRGLRTNRYKFVVHFNHGKLAEMFLFDLKKDPYELQNVIDQYPSVKDKMLSEIKNRLRNIGDYALPFFDSVK